VTKVYRQPTQKSNPVGPHIAIYKNRGWVKLWREQFGHPISESKPWCDGYAWSYLYSQANYKRKTVNFRNQCIELERGQFLTSSLKLSRLFGWSRRRIRGFCERLANDEMCTIRRTNRFMVITILNYDRFQSTEVENETTDVTTDGTTDAQQMHTTKKYRSKKIKKGGTYSDSFETFWKEYPKKVKKQKAFWEWEKAKPDSEMIMDALRKQIKYKERLQSEKRFYPEWCDPERWIKDQRWSDEVPDTRETAKDDPWEEAQREKKERDEKKASKGSRKTEEANSNLS